MGYIPTNRIGYGVSRYGHHTCRSTYAHGNNRAGADITRAMNRVVLAIIGIGLLLAYLLNGTNDRLDRMNELSNQTSGSIRFN
jgi:hypothetical protein